MERTKIPGYSLYEIDSKGRVFRVSDGERIVGSVNPSGYHNRRLKGDDGEVKTIGRHRLLAMTFIPCDGDISKLTVNHINGVLGR